MAQLLPLLEKWKQENFSKEINEVDITDINTGWTLVLPDLWTDKDVLKIPILGVTDMGLDRHHTRTLSLITKTEGKFVNLIYDPDYNSVISDGCCFFDKEGNKIYIPELRGWNADYIKGKLFFAWVDNIYYKEIKKENDLDYDMIIIVE